MGDAPTGYRAGEYPPVVIAHIVAQNVLVLGLIVGVLFLLVWVLWLAIGMPGPNDELVWVRRP